MYADKEKALSYISASAPIADATYKKETVSETSEDLHLSAPIAEALDNQELSSAANIVENFENPVVEEENLRLDGRTQTDDDLSMANDPVGKLTGKSTRTARQRRAFAERERGRMVKRVEELAEKLHLAGVEIVTDASTLQGARAKAKGFYSRSTGRITIVIPNHADTFDVEQTLLHEAVAHYGLRQLFGEHFDTFLDNVYEYAEAGIRERIDQIEERLYRADIEERTKQKGGGVFARAEAVTEAEAKRRNGDYRKTATEEYLASLAENTDFENTDVGWWQKIKELFLRMLHKIGFEDFPLIMLSDNELRYILWRSYENLVEPGRYRSIFGEAADVAKQAELKVGNYAPAAIGENRAAEDGDGELEEVNQRFNEELQQQVDGNLPKGHIYRLGMPGDILQSTGFPNLPIELSSTRLAEKAGQRNHPFELSDVRNLVNALNDPVAVFTYGDKSKAQNVIVEIERAGKKFVVGVSFSPVVGGGKLEINSIRGIFPKDTAEWLNWIAQGKLLYANKNKIQAIMAQQRINLADVDYLDLDSIAKIVRNFENPGVETKNDVLFREGDAPDYERALARERYEQRVRSRMYQVREAVADSMAGLKEAMDAILRGEGKKGVHIEDVAGYENAYLGENRLSSVNKAEADAFARLLFKPLLAEMSRLAHTADERAGLTDYMMAKHGLERNRVMAEREAKKAYEEAQKKHPHSRKTEADFVAQCRERDYAGLTALTGLDGTAEAEAEAARMVEAYESTHDTGALWERVRAVTGAPLLKMYETGFLTREAYEDIRGMYDCYIPLRGFDEKTSREAYAYLGHGESAFNAPIKAAKGRKSKADDPLANMEAMAESTIMQGNRNVLVKQRFLNFALNHPSDLVSVGELWLKHDDVTDEWHPVTADLHEEDSPEEVRRKTEAFEERMRRLAEAEPERYKHGKEAADIPYRVVEGRDLREHQVVVRRGGRDYRG